MARSGIRVSVPAATSINTPVTDLATGAFQARSVGHLFLPIPCLGPTGVPTTDKTCAYNATVRTWGACTTAGCHGDATAAVAAFTLSRQRMDDLTKQIWDDLNADDVVDDADGGYLADVVAIPPAEFLPTDGRVSPAEGARFNVRMLRIVDGGDGSSGVHNPFLAEALLRANIDELKATYPGLPALRARVQEIMKGPLGAITKRPLSRPLISRPITTR